MEIKIYSDSDGTLFSIVSWLHGLIRKYSYASLSDILEFVYSEETEPDFMRFVATNNGKNVLLMEDKMRDLGYYTANLYYIDEEELKNFEVNVKKIEEINSEEVRYLNRRFLSELVIRAKRGS